MAELLLSTTGTQATTIITDLGERTFIHPVTNLDLLLEYKHSEIIGSADLNAAVAAGFITLTDTDGVLFPIVQDQAPIKNNFDAGVPGVTNDIDEGYSKNSLWVKTAVPIAIFVCLDNTAGAAVWGQVTIGGALTLGSIPFSDGTTLIDDNAKLFWDNVKKNMGIGTNTPVTSALLDLLSTSKGFLPPRMTTAQIDAISSPAEGLVAYDTDTEMLRLRKSSEWCHIPCGVVTGQFSDSTDQKPGVLTPVPITFNTNDITLIGLSHSTTVNPEEFTATLAKAFTFMLAPQWERTSGGQDDTIDFFIQKDTGGGFVNVVNSNVKVVTGMVETNVIPLMYTINMASGDKVRFMQRVSDTGDGLGIKTTAADAEVPATPSIILTVFSGD